MRVPRLTGEQLLEAALRSAQRREEASKREGQFIVTDTFRYPAELEERRWKRTRQVIARIQPGIDDDPVYLAELAREAASIELVVSTSLTRFPSQEVLALCDHVLLGTTSEIDADASSNQQGKDALVLLKMGLIEFLYQAAKSVTMSWKKGITGPDRVLRKDSYPVDLLSATLDAYLFEGKPRVAGFDPPPDEYWHNLAMLTESSERFVIAHEYGHALWQELGIHNVPAIPQSNWQKEMEADFFAGLYVTKSGEILDRRAPNIVLQGAFFSLEALDILRRAREIVYFGAIQDDHGSETHPPIAMRTEYLKKLYDSAFRVNVLEDGSRLNYGEFDDFYGNQDIYDLSIDWALGPSSTLEKLWDLIEPRFVEAHHTNRKLHPVWRALMPRSR